jgi:uncharacterized protein (TIGR02217 family)
MSRFKDVYMPAKVPGYPCISRPRFKTSIRVSAGGHEDVNQEWEHPLHSFSLPQAGGRDWAVVDGLMDHFRVMRGPFHTFPWRDPLDFASRPLILPDQVPPIAATDQVVGTGDGFTDTFQLTKIYAVDDETYQRPIVLPVVASVMVAIDGVLVDPGAYTVSRRGGIVTFAIPPEDGTVISAGFLFDVEVRFESDDAVEGILRTYAIGGFSEIVLIETRAC